MCEGTYVVLKASGARFRVLRQLTFNLIWMYTRTHLTYISLYIYISVYVYVFVSHGFSPKSVVYIFGIPITSIVVCWGLYGGSPNLGKLSDVYRCIYIYTYVHIYIYVYVLYAGLRPVPYGFERDSKVRPADCSLGLSFPSPSNPGIVQRCQRGHRSYA